MTNNEKLSYWKGDTSDPLQTLTIGQLIDNSADRFADRIAISVHKGQKLTYRQVQQQVTINYDQESVHIAMRSISQISAR